MKDYTKDFKKAAKYIAKQDQVIINAVSEAVLISDGHFIVKIAMFDYDLFFRTGSPRFPEVKDGDKYTSDKRTCIPGRCEMDLEKCIPDPDDEGKEVIASNFLEELETGTLTRVFLTKDNEIISINEDYYKNLKCFHPKRCFNGKGRRAPIVTPYLKYETQGVLILPINTGNRKLTITC